jgi:glucose/arabinose dehydrogenase
MAARTTGVALVLVTALGTSVAAQLRSETIVRGLVNPVAIVALPNDRSAFLVVEQRGLIRVARDGLILEPPFLDLRGEVRSGGEQGLLGIALAPDYVESRRLFLNFTNRDGDTVVARFRTSADNPFAGDPESRFDLMWPNGRRIIDQPFTNHNGGHLAFGPDGYLYIGLGDGGSGGDPMNHAQDPQSLLGKMLRIDINVPDEDVRGYRVPEDNPFVDGEPVRALPEIWAFGLRNPWRYSFDDWTRGGTSALMIADVGQNAREEINFEPSGRGGRNYGWRLREGRQAFDTRTVPAFTPLSEPIHDYGRSVGASITGGLIYRGGQLDASFKGRYFYADFVSGRVFSIGLHVDPVTGEASADDEREHTTALGRGVLGSVSSFAPDHDGEILVLNYDGGLVIRIVPDTSTAECCIP